MHIITGLPRSGSTLLANILNQNPRFHASETSALPGLLAGIRHHWESVIENRTAPKLETKKRVLRAVAAAYYDTDKVVFDKNRLWLREVNLAQFLFGEDVSFIVTVRDLVDILASFERLHRQQAAFFESPDVRNLPDQTSTVFKRCELLASEKGAVGQIIGPLEEFLTVIKPNYLLVEYRDLTKFPKAVLEQIYEFTGEEPYEHNFDKVKQKTKENDAEHGILGLHNISEQVIEKKSYAEEILGPVLHAKYKGNEFWRKI